MKIVLIGKSNSGKTYLAEMLQQNGLKPIISTTTRPKRDYEKDGIHYHFISKDEFEKRHANQEFAEVDLFNDWYYGLTYDAIKEGDIMILTPRGFKQVEHFLNEKIFVIYLETTIPVKIDRIEDRDGVNTESQRRWITDDIDFDEFNRMQKWDLKIIINDKNGIDKLVNIIKNIK